MTTKITKRKKTSIRESKLLLKRSKWKFWSGKLEKDK
jgi:hypothetical protein